MYRRTLTLMMLMLPALTVIKASPRVLNLDSCRTLAVDNNKELRKSEMEMRSAYYNRKSAFTNYLPKVSVTGMYMHTGKELSLLSDEQKARLNGLGSALGMPALDAVGHGLTEALRTDTRNMAGAAAVLTQPLYTGGKIRAYHRITEYAEKVAADRRDMMYQQLVVDVDETYWNIVELSARKQLAAKYLSLVQTLDSDVSRMIDAGVATKADGLSVKVKVNEADVAVIQVDNGLEILKMRMCQLCGLPFDTEIVLADENRMELPEPLTDGIVDSESWQDRPELSALGTSVMMHEEMVKIARSEFLPSVALTGGYFASYPSVFNSFEKKFKGTWNVGVAVKIPVITWGDRSYKVRSARAQAAVARLDYEETREKIELQVAQSRQKVREAHEKYVASLSSQAAAEENLRYATIGLREGVIPVSNVIEAQTAWLSAKTGLISSGIGVRMADIYLRKALGTIR